MEWGRTISLEIGLLRMETLPNAWPPGSREGGGRHCRNSIYPNFFLRNDKSLNFSQTIARQWQRLRAAQWRPQAGEARPGTYAGAEE